MKLLDCTLRDGGYYTKWDFSSGVVAEYIKATNLLPIDYIEIGYRNKPSNEYLGEFAYCPLSVLEEIKSQTTKKLVVMLNEKSMSVCDVKDMVGPLEGIVDMVRIATAPINIENGIAIAKEIKKYGFEVALNVMYMSTWKNNCKFLDKLSQADNVVDLFCMVDSYGGATPKDISEIIPIVRSRTTVPLGFHGHDNLHMGLINSLTALEDGVDCIDATILGMGRGAGNLKMELLLTYLNKEGLEVDFNTLGDLITSFSPLLCRYQWGAQLPYMIAGANSIPQKDVMELVENRAYSFESVIHGLQNRKDKIADNAKYPLLPPKQQYDVVIVVGGGTSPDDHFEGIKKFICSQKNVAIVFATARHARLYQDVKASKYYCLVGREERRLEANMNGDLKDGICVLPPFPRKLGTNVPDFAKDVTYELPVIEFTDNFKDSCTTLAIQTSLNLSKKDIFVVGYDGYPGNILSEKEASLTNENRILFGDYEKYSGHKMMSLLPSLYSELDVTSIYTLI